MSKRFASRIDAANKVEWEGGLAEALEYGITAADMPDAELKTAWRAMENAYKKFTKAADAVQDLLPDPE